MNIREALQEVTEFLSILMDLSGDAAEDALINNGEEIEGRCRDALAAPDPTEELIEACKMLLSCAGPGSLSYETARKAARAAIAKVEGVN